MRPVAADSALRTRALEYHPLGTLDRSLTSARRMETEDLPLGGGRWALTMGYGPGQTTNVS